MGERKEKTNAKGVEKKNDAGEKPAGDGEKDDGIATILLKLDLHCEGCAKRVRRSVLHFEGVEDVKADYSTGKLTVKGNVDPLWLREIVERKTKTKVSLLSAQPKKVGSDGGGGGGGGGDKKSDEKVEKKAEAKEGEDTKPKKTQFNRKVMKIRLHYDGSAQKVKRFIKELTPYLKDKLNRNVDVVPPKKDDGSGGGDNKKEKEVGSGYGRGKKKDGELKVTSKSTVITEPKEKKTEVINKMDYYGYNNPNTYYTMPPMYNQNYSNQDYGVTMHDHGYGHTGYVPPPPYLTTPCDHGYGHSGYVPPPYLTAPQLFSDENPNACSVM